ncbi:hypothetical protein [Mesomycoplasma hyorhinis]|uniref:hypothetical protein n=1 Tax=Mesomycoplasma hyorhinis TaxID=2100 RepID=UPI001F4056BC|nr:hypothetical protein [Mesomycoplasma hyorhinis]
MFKSSRGILMLFVPFFIILFFELLFIYWAAQNTSEIKINNNHIFSVKDQLEVYIPRILEGPWILIPNFFLMHLLMWSIMQFKKNSYLYKEFIFYYKDYYYFLIWLFFLVINFVYTFLFFSLLLVSLLGDSNIPINFAQLFFSSLIITLFFSPLPLIYFVIKSKKYSRFLTIFYLIIFVIFYVSLTARLSIYYVIYKNKISDLGDVKRTYLRSINYYSPLHLLLRSVGLLFKNPYKSSNFYFYSKQWFNYVDLISFTIILTTLNISILATTMIKGAKWVKFN